MLEGKRIVVVLPAYNAARTLRQTVAEISRDLVDEILLVDDASQDETVRLAKELGLQAVVHDSNKGYGANQKTCYREALALGADVVVMLHPDYQYSPKLLPAMAAMVSSGHYDVVLGSRILGGGALTGGMPLYKYIANRLLTAGQNLLIGQKLSEYHTGYRAFSREVLGALPLDSRSAATGLTTAPDRSSKRAVEPRAGSVLIRTRAGIDAPRTGKRARRLSNSDAPIADLTQRTNLRYSAGFSEPYSNR